MKFAYTIILATTLVVSTYAEGYGLLGGYRNYDSYSSGGYYNRPSYYSGGYPSSIGGGYYDSNPGYSSYGGYDNSYYNRPSYSSYGSYGSSYGGYPESLSSTDDTVIEIGNKRSDYVSSTTSSYESGYSAGGLGGYGGYRTNYLGSPYGYRGYGYSSYKK